MKKGLSVLVSIWLIMTLTGCESIRSKIKDIKGDLIGNSFSVMFYNNAGSQFLKVTGNKVSVSANTVETESISPDGSSTVNYENSSVITITVDGSNMDQVGNTVIFEEKGLSPLKDFSLLVDVQAHGGSLNFIDRDINHFKNLFGTPKIVVVCSQLGVPIAVYGGKSVYWEVPSDLPKMTKLSVDGKALYVHRANYVILDSDML